MTQDDNTPQDQTKDPLQTRIQELEAELEAMTETAKRTLADLQNFKRRADEERSELKVFANKQLLSAIFPALDNFARALEQTPEELKDHEWIKGIQATENNLMGALKAQGLEPIDQSGVPFDPNLHEGLMEGNGPKGQVIQIFEKGYSFNGKCVRPAKVMVGKD